MLSVLALMIAAAGLGISLTLAARLRIVEGELKAARTLPPPVAELPAVENPLEGLRIAIQIEQDHPHPIFANLVKEALLREQVEIVESEYDLLISGTLVGNGYADVYYAAEFACRTPKETLLTLIDRPAHGDRPGNLAIELVTRIKVEYEKTNRRNERRVAMRELKD